jgi:scyllo-inositol 2-dehydrogenase (NADP+)
MNKLNVALCSFGMSGKLFHAPFIACHPGLNLYAAWERSKFLIQEFYPEVISYPTLEQILEDPLVDLVIVNTPSYSHYEYAKKVIEGKKHLIVEKPFTATSEQAKELVSLAREHHVKLSVFQNRRWDSDFKTVRYVQERGILGDIFEAEFHYDRFNLALSPKPHKETPGPAVGVLYDLGPHLIDQAISLFGMPPKLFADVMMTRPASQVDDYFELIFQYPNKRVRLKAGYIVREPIPSFVLHGTKGSFLKPRADVQEADLLAGKKPDDPDWGLEPESGQGLIHTEINGEVIKEYIPSLSGNYMDYYDAVYLAINQNQEMPVSGESGIKTIQIIEAAIESSRSGTVVSL